MTFTSEHLLQQEGCAVDAATLAWGFKESFRSYISGSIANGEWTVSDGATYATPSFGWAHGTGSYGPAGTGLVRFDGAVSFTGHGGILDTTIAAPRIEFVDADSALLLLDVTGTTQDGAVVDEAGVEFADLDLTAATVEFGNGILTVTDAPATLTADGAEAFGTYPAGEPLDPVTFALTLDGTCASAAVQTDTAADLGWLGWVAAGVVLIAVAIVYAVLRRSIRRS